ncbi:hypothetical protein AVMA1855_22645 [Acidovorax sp. SUPP1855]|nr:hypothetical protein [Acidovorax sp. SUPP1855]GKS87003.1 hypothetical protein AVMA1855_22645 [Acidovorax sp. SUPP1855]
MTVETDETVEGRAAVAALQAAQNRGYSDAAVDTIHTSQEGVAK